MVASSYFVLAVFLAGMLNGGRRIVGQAPMPGGSIAIQAEMSHGRFPLGYNVNRYIDLAFVILQGLARFLAGVHENRVVSVGLSQ